MSSRLGIKEVKTRKKKKKTGGIGQRKTTKKYIFLLVFYWSAQGAADANVCPGITRPLIVCFRL